MNSKTEEISGPCRLNKQEVEEVLKNPDSRFKIYFQLPLTRSSVESYVRDMPDKDTLMKRYKPRTGCTISWEQESFKKWSEINIEKIESLLENPTLILDGLDIDLSFSINDPTENIGKKNDDLKKFYESMKSLLGNIGHLLQTKDIYLHVHNQSEAAGLLKYINSKSLKHISIRVCDRTADEAIEMNFSELEIMKQWKDAETLKITGNYILTPIESFASFETITVWVNEITIGSLIEVKQLFIQSPNLKTFIIESSQIPQMKDVVIMIYGEFDSYDEVVKKNAAIFRDMPKERERYLERRTWKVLKNLPDSTEKLQIILNIGWEDYIKLSKV